MRRHAFGRHDLQRGPGRRERHELGGERRRDPGARRGLHHVTAPADDGERKPVGDRLPHHDQIGLEPIAFGGAADRQPADGLDLIHDQHRSDPARFGPEHVEPFPRRLLQNDRLERHRREAVARGANECPPPLHIVERQQPADGGAGGDPWRTHRLRPSRASRDSRTPARAPVRCGSAQSGPPRPWPPHRSSGTGPTRPMACSRRSLRRSCFLQHRRQRFHHARLGGRAHGGGHRRMRVTEGDGAQAHDVVGVLRDPISSHTRQPAERSMREGSPVPVPEPSLPKSASGRLLPVEVNPGMRSFIVDSWRAHCRCSWPSRAGSWRSPGARTSRRRRSTRAGQPAAHGWAAFR